jgi:protease-4
MSDVPPLSPTAGSPQRLPPVARRGSTVLGIFLGLSMAINLVLVAGIGLLIFLAARWSTGSDRKALVESHYAGNKSATDKIAVIRIDGVLIEGLTGYTNRQIEQAAKDKHVKAIVIRINSPGGSITESDHLHHRLTELRDGKDGNPAKPLVVSMGSLAASGGYYIAMPGKTIFAERTTITGSIGVYASFPNVKELGDKFGVHVNLIKAGRAKDSGSPFQEMKAEERYMWQQMVNHAYDQFKNVVETGRPALKGKLEEEVINQAVKAPDRLVVEDNGRKSEKFVEKEITYVRQRADGGIWTADKALEYGLIDKIGYLEDAVKDAAKSAGLGENYAVITYDKPPALLDLFGGGVKAPETPLGLDPAKLGDALTPRLWFMGPESELAGFVQTVGR